MSKIKNSLVSIVVPVYNVGQYVDKCVRSTLSQTYRNIEVITINDGSTDNSLEVLTKLAKSDDRIVIINQNNSGVSSARNKGIYAARGEYIIFVDGDDWLAEDCVEYMLKVINETSSKMAISINNFTTRDDKQILNDKINVWSSSRTVANFLYPGIAIGSWNKIFQRDFLIKNTLRFHETMFMGEGMRFITDAAQRTDTIGVGHRKVYWYRLNNASSATTIPSVEHGLAAIDAIEGIESNLVTKDEQILDAINYHKWMNTFYLIRILLANRVIESFHTDLYRNSVHSLRKKGLSKILHANVSMSSKLKMIGILLSPLLMAKLVNAQKAYSLRRDRTA